ncbi:RNA-dependent RNA polymerase [Macrophomina phaseolina single-stranded RNA virus 1]|uniref:RNA-dependent RNA polymerase n=1 Tax=Macrophomina phaseolina single-stranded RNA virus 1 TaxID=1708488 RepID=A0AAC8ZT25_9VIRU|nr:RNA-dependent RNA polymerase [Macrophomina phaseolina single-stranded RNA virus 1]ALD89094.1 RNA-dependent RNA polymerase [Macrophomina phaseolina single-stranded RNA virus 1]
MFLNIVWIILATVFVASLTVFSLLIIWGGFGVTLGLLASASYFCGAWGILVFLVLGPFAGLWIIWVFKDSLTKEKILIDQVGADAALWTSFETHAASAHPLKMVFKEAYWRGHDLSGPWLVSWAEALGLPEDMKVNLEDGVVRLGSRAWSYCVLQLLSLSNSWASPLVGAGVAWLYARFVWRTCGRLSLRVLAIAELTFLVLVCLPGEEILPLLIRCTYSVLRAIVRFTKRREEFWEWAHWRYVSLVVKFLAAVESLNEEFQKHHSKAIARGSSRLTQHFKTFVMRASIVISDIGLPSYVRRRGGVQPSKEALEASMALMRDLGWPVNVKLDEPDLDKAFSWKEWVLCGSDFKQGIHNLKLQVDEDLEALRIAGLNYRRTEEYASFENELEATSRYFRSPRYDYPDLELDDVWFLLKDIFERSRLTPFNHIIRMWEKKYALGAFMRDPFRARSKYKRSRFIHDIGGYGPFKKLWASTFYWASQILPTSAVSVKNEALPEKKWAANKVRSIIGSPISQYILSTIWNYGPNHHFAWVSTPIKVGMPLNGYWMSTIWQRHARCQIHVEGDFSQFDSTISGEVVSMIKAIRKKGFEGHKDRERIAELIDINYDQVVHQLLNTTSSGNVYLKGTGLTTGHSSTSMDNSVGLVVLYLMAWKSLTGLSAREFKYYNELSCFGDDHVLSILATKPAIWTPKNIRGVMLKWGVTNNLEVKQRLDQVTFLSKFGRKANTTELRELGGMGIKAQFIVWHDKAKLVGKLTAPITNKAASYRVKRLLSYLSITAHHPDVYDGMVKVLVKSKSLMAHMKNNGIKIPSYTKVMRDWYSPSPESKNVTHLDEIAHEFENTGYIVQYGEVTALDAIVGALSVAPDLLSPILFNYGYMRALQGFLRSRLAWTVDLLCLNNQIMSAGMLENVASRTPYRWLETALFVPGLSGVNETTLLIRHWLYLVYMRHRPRQKFGATLNFIIQRIANLQFALNGRVLLENRQHDLQIDCLIVAALLSLIAVPDWIAPAGKIILPDVQLLVDSVVHFIMVMIWQAVPPNFRETTSTLRTFDRKGGPVGVQAPTGTGKSTAFVQHVAMVAGHRFRKIVVIQPRSLLVHGLTSYMADFYGLEVTGATSGLKLDPTKRVVYITPQALMGHLDLLNHENLIILDECHLAEPHYGMLREIIRKAKLPSLWVSATLPESLQSICQLVIDIPLANLWDVDTQVVNRDGTNMTEVLNDYEAYCKDVGNQIGPSQKALIFVPTIAMAERLVDKCRHPAIALHSNSKINPDWSARVIYSTPVADVGITIPDVTFVMCANFTTIKGNELVVCDGNTIAQRRGRTGRTNNGLFRLVRYNAPMRQPDFADVSSPLNIRQLLVDGVPPRFLAALNTEAVLSAFGVPPAEDETALEDQLRALEIFMANMRPVLLAATSARATADPNFGPPMVLHHTGIGNISSSFPQPDSGINEEILNLASEMLGVKSGVAQTISTDLLDKFDRMSGPIVKVGNLIQGILSGSRTDMLNPRNSEPTGLLDEVYALHDIYTILRDL